MIQPPKDILIPSQYCESTFQTRVRPQRDAQHAWHPGPSRPGPFRRRARPQRARLSPQRRKTRTVWAGKVPIGSEHPIAKQTMTTTDTRNVEATVDQVMRCAEAGADLVRLTVQGKKEAEACFKVKDRLLQKGCDVPLVADIHFQPAVAMMVADAFEKVRINPGNFADGAKKFETLTYAT